MRRALNQPAQTKVLKPPATQQRRTELGMTLEELRELEEKAVRLEKLAMLLLNTPQQAFYLYDHQQQRFELGQEHVSGLYGYKAGEIEQRPGGWFSIIHPNDREEFEAMHRRMMHRPGNEVHSMRARVLKKGGGHEWIQSYMRPFERDAQGQVQSEVGMVIIITPLMEAERALRETEARCHSLFQGNTAGVLVFDRTCHIVDANPALCRLLGYEKNALRRLEVLDLTAPGTRAVMHKLLRAMQSGDRPPPSMDATMQRRNGD